MRTRAVASRIAFTVATDRSCLGCFRGLGCAPMGPPNASGRRADRCYFEMRALAHIMTSTTYPLPKTEPITWKGLPLLGPLFDIRRSELETFEKMAAVGDAVFFQVLHRRLHLLNHPEHYRHVLIDA